MNMKLLAPAGDMESLKMAVFNGADEVYLGVKNFNARNIEGFTLETLKEAVNFSHIYGVKVFLTVNILFKNEEIQDALDLVVDAYNLGVDAFILQDVGLASIINRHYPEIELHASTQMGIHNLEGVKQLEKLGFKRVVLARETPLSEIRRIRENSKMEIEYFCQGALCVSFSGNCYMSSYLFDASGNRGKCKQLCRLPFGLMHNDERLKTGYLLSAKDICMLNRLRDLELAGVTSLKIEGRARRAYYVAVATKIYRDALDEKPYKNELKLAFNRGYTEGYFNGNNNIISNIQNHIGIEIGEVKKINLGKNFNEIFITNKIPFSPKSTLKFIRGNEEVATLSAFDIKVEKNLTKITSKSVVKPGDKAHLITDYEKEVNELKKIKKVFINLNLKAKENEQIYLKCSVRGKTLEFFGEKLERAKNAPITKEDIKNCFIKSDIFEPNLECELENVFILKSKLNEFRRQVYDGIKEELTKLNHKKLEKLKLLKIPPLIELKNIQFIETENENLKEEIIVYDPEIYDEKTILNVKKRVEKSMKKFVLNLPNFALKNDVAYLKNLAEKNNISIMIQNMYALDFCVEKYVGGGMNIYNGYSKAYYSLPCVLGENGSFKQPYMTLRHCPMKEHVGASCENCLYDKNYSYILNGKELKLKRKKLTSCTFYLTNK